MRSDRAIVTVDVLVYLTKYRIQPLISDQGSHSSMPAEKIAHRRGANAIYAE